MKCPNKEEKGNLGGQFFMMKSIERKADKELGEVRKESKVTRFWVVSWHCTFEQLENGVSCLGRMIKRK